MSNSPSAVCKYCGKLCDDSDEGNVCSDCSQSIRSLKHRSASEPDFRRNRRLGYIAYIPFGFLVLKRYSKDSLFVRHHARRGALFTVATVITVLACLMLFLVFPPESTLPRITTGVILLLWTFVFAFLTLISPNMK